jgi:hypothetical protein
MNMGRWLKTVIRGAKIIFSVTLRVIMGRAGFIAHIRVIGGVGSPFSSVSWSSVPDEKKCCKWAWRGSF